jgi:predicted DNA-binding ribbon-helix-helix protein
MNLTKRSISLEGHATSVALEPEFWAVLDSCARANGQSLASLIGTIDIGRGTTPLASALRVWALRQASEGVGLR